MPKYQLTLSPDYVRDWTYVEAVREIFQNALDNQTTYPENEMFFSYEVNVLKIGNKTSVLTLDTLLLGTTTKKDDENTIGTHGEGYKVALMVLLREGKKVTIYNYGAREIWGTRLVKSRRFNGAMVTEVDVQKQAFFKSVPSHNLIIEIEGITEEEYQDIVESNLHLQEDIEKYTTSNGMGDILLNPVYRGKVFVNGLYVTSNDNFKYGYNIMPKHIKLDRDRKLIDTFDLSWITSKMWRHVGQEDLVAELLLENVVDVRHIKSRSEYYSYSEEKETDRKIAESLHNKFVTEYGENTIPVSDNRDLEKVARTHKTISPVIVPSSVTEYLEDKIEMPEVLVKTPYERLTLWFEQVEHKLTEEEQEDFKIILEDLK